MVQKLKRLPDWQARLANEMDRQRLSPFSWGVNDCAIGLARGVCMALTGQELIGDWRGSYKTERGALRKLREAGFADLGEAVSSYLPEVPPAMADVGDLALIATDSGLGGALGVFDMSGLVVLTKEGHGRVARASALRAFKIGESQ